MAEEKPPPEKPAETGEHNKENLKLPVGPSGIKDYVLKLFMSATGLIIHDKYINEYVNDVNTNNYLKMFAEQCIKLRKVFDMEQDFSAQNFLDNIWPIAEQPVSFFGCYGKSALEVAYDFAKKVSIATSFNCSFYGITPETSLEPMDEKVITWGNIVKTNLQELFSDFLLDTSKIESERMRIKSLIEIECSKIEHVSADPDNLNSSETKQKQQGDKRGETKIPKKKLKPLSEKAAAVLELLKTLPKHRGMTGPKILEALDEKNILIDQSTLTKNIIPELKPHGVKNRPRIGYYIEQ